MESSSTKQEEEESATLLSSIIASSNSFECLSLPLERHPPSVVRRKFLKLSLQVHPDKNAHALAKEAFQHLSTAFETLYDEESQTKHLQEALLEQQAAAATAAQEEKKKEERPNHQNKKRKTTHPNWKQQKEEAAKQKKAPVWKRWEDVVADLARREQLEKEFIRKKSDEQLERKVKGLMWKAMKVCRALDERAGCPPTFVNGLWAPLYEQEATRGVPLPGGWKIVRKGIDGVVMYRNVQTGEESEAHPDAQVEGMIQKARKAERTNKFRVHEEPRLFLGEIVEYLREDHDYKGMDEDILELEEEERERDNPKSRNEREYDY